MQLLNRPWKECTRKMTKASSNESPLESNFAENKRRLTISEALREAIAEEMRRDPSVFLKSPIRDDNPVLVFDHKLLYGSKGRQQAGGFDLTAYVPTEEYLIPLGKAVVKRNGKDVTIVATHLSLYRSLAAAEELATQG